MSEYAFNLDEREVYRYLGYGGIVPREGCDAEIKNRIERIEGELTRAAEPRAIWKYYPLTVPEEGVLKLGDIRVKSESLLRNLKGCNEVCMLAVTIGPTPDRFMQRARYTEAGSEYFYQAIGAAMVEEYADHINEVIRQEAQPRGLYLRPRFSPGYGDFDIEHQRDFAAVLNMAKEIGITLTDSCMMVPTKSITAVIGLSQSDTRCPVAGCETCNKSDTCIYKR